MKRTTQLQAFNGVGAGQVAVCPIPRGLSIHGILLTRGGTFTQANMEEIVIKSNGNPILETTGADLDVMNGHDQLAVGGANLTYISFDRVGLLDQGQIEATRLGTGFKKGQVLRLGADPLPEQIKTLTCEIQIASGAVAPTLSGKVIRSGRSVLGVIRKLRKFSGYAPAAAGMFGIADLPTGDAINRIWIKGANINEVTLVGDQGIVFQRTQAENDYILNNGVKAAQAGWFVIDPTETGVGNDPISTAVQDFRIKLDMSGASALTVYVEYLGGLEGN